MSQLLIGRGHSLAAQRNYTPGQLSGYVLAVAKAERERQELASHNAMVARGSAGKDLAEAFPALYNTAPHKADTARIARDRAKFAQLFG